jgi:hypothetical protein
MKKQLILVLAIAGMVAANGNLVAQQKKLTGVKPMNMSTNSSMNLESEMLKNNMRKLWEDHIVWTRNVIFCLVDGLPGTDQASKRLMKNQDDIGNAIKHFYGEEAGNKLAQLLHSHITIAVDVINAAKVSDKPKLDDANKRWTDNADEISEFLSKANPFWKIEEMKKMMHDHLKLTTNEVVDRISKMYDADVMNYEEVHIEILKMSDMLADGIVKQFPNKFQPVLSEK